jgi:hypothetical protein
VLLETRRKLREAHFFLQLFKAEQARFLRNDPEASYYYLSALLSAARSVGDYACSEGGEQYKKWWGQRRAELTP